LSICLDIGLLLIVIAFLFIFEFYGRQEIPMRWLDNFPFRRLLCKSTTLNLFAENKILILYTF
jgi:hypothetical protein